MSILVFKRKAWNYLIINFLFVLCRKVQRVVGISREFREIISDPINLSASDGKIVQNAELPMVTDEVSVTLRLNILSYVPDYYTCVFHKGYLHLERTPSVWLNPKYMGLHVRFSTYNDPNVGIGSVGGMLTLNQWYYLAYTLSEPEKRLDFYIDGQWVAFQSIEKVQTDHIIFNNGPLHIGNNNFEVGVTGQISNFRYYNWRLSAEEVVEQYSATNFTLTTTSSTTPTSIQPGKSNNIAIMAGISICSSLISVFLTIICLYFIKSYKEKKKQDQPSDQCNIDESSKQHGTEVLNNSTRQRGSDV